MNFKVTYPNIETALRASKMFELRKKVLLSVMDGKYKTARKFQKEFAKNAVEDFDTFTTLPKLTFTNVPLKVWFALLAKNIKFKIYRAFTKNSPDEKLLAKKFKVYKKSLTKEELKKNQLEVKFPDFY